MIFGLTVVSLFAMNVMITGEVNYQGGDRNTFYGGAGPDSRSRRRRAVRRQRRARHQRGAVGRRLSRATH